MKTLFLALAMLLPACGMLQGSSAQMIDQLAGVWLVYDQSPKGEADIEAAVASIVAMIGADFDLDAVVPSATGVLLVGKLVEDHPELAPYQSLLEKLYTLAIYGSSAEETK